MALTFSMSDCKTGSSECSSLANSTRLYLWLKTKAISWHTVKYVCRCCLIVGLEPWWPQNAPIFCKYPTVILREIAASLILIRIVCGRKSTLVFSSRQDDYSSSCFAAHWMWAFFFLLYFKPWPDFWRSTLFCLISFGYSLISPRVEEWHGIWHA